MFLFLSVSIFECVCPCQPVPGTHTLLGGSRMGRSPFPGSICKNSTGFGGRGGPVPPCF